VSTPRPLLVTNDPDLLDDLLRLAAAADVEVDVAVDPVAARARWSAAPLVLLGADLAGSTVIAQSPARVGVVLVCRGAPEDDVAAGRQTPTMHTVLRLPDAEEAIVERLAKSAAPATSAGFVVGVLGGCGGAGASVLAAALGVSASRRHQPALLVDLDPLGGGLDLLLGVEEIPGLRWSDLAGVSGRLPPAALRDALPTRQGLAVLSFTPQTDVELSPDAVCAVVETGRRDGLVILDLPRHPASPTAAAVGLVDELVLVVPADVRAASSAAQVASCLAGSARDAGVVVRRRAASTLTPDAVAEAASLPLLGQTRPESGLAALLSSGRPLRFRRRGPLATLCDQLLDRWRAPAGERAA
jgi:secretion/DNA translocation related CpaE-like protein